MEHISDGQCLRPSKPIGTAYFCTGVGLINPHLKWQPINDSQLVIWWNIKRPKKYWHKHPKHFCAVNLSTHIESQYIYRSAEYLLFQKTNMLKEPSVYRIQIRFSFTKLGIVGISATEHLTVTKRLFHVLEECLRDGRLCGQRRWAKLVQFDRKKDEVTWGAG